MHDGHARCAGVWPGTYITISVGLGPMTLLPPLHFAILRLCGVGRGLFQGWNMGELKHRCRTVGLLWDP